jgi:hypothetical protein
LALNVPVASVILAALLIWVSDEVVVKFLADVVCVILMYALSKHFVFVGEDEERGWIKASGSTDI